MIFFNEALFRSFARGWQARHMQQPVEHGKIGKEAVGKDTVEVKLQIGELDQSGAVTQQPHHPAIGDNSVELFGEVQVLLQHGVGRHPQGGFFGLSVEAGRLIAADNLDCSSAPVSNAVGDRVKLGVQFDTLCLKLKLVPKQSEQWYHPSLRLKMRQ